MAIDPRRNRRRSGGQAWRRVPLQSLPGTRRWRVSRLLARLPAVSRELVKSLPRRRGGLVWTRHHEYPAVAQLQTTDEAVATELPEELLGRLLEREDDYFGPMRVKLRL